jgi:hypothetical protein
VEVLQQLLQYMMPLLEVAAVVVLEFQQVLVEVLLDP